VAHGGRVVGDGAIVVFLLEVQGSAIEQRVRESWLQPDGPLEVRQGSGGVLAFVPTGAAEVVERLGVRLLRILRIETQRPLEVLDGAVEFDKLSARCAAVEEGVGRSGVVAFPDSSLAAWRRAMVWLAPPRRL
jgi:hypothetical protein